MFNHLRYFFLSLQHVSRRDFLRGGFGIASRHRRCATYWQPHLELSKQFVRLALSQAQAQEVVILGAGRLLDVPLDALAEHATRVTLIDWDPGALREWRRAARYLKSRGVHLTMLQADITERLHSWTHHLSTMPAPSASTGVQAYAEALRSLPSLARTARTLLQRTPDLVISLNLLSQLGLYWEDRAHSQLSPLTTEEGEFKDPVLEEALRNTKRCLEEEHLALLSECGARAVALISDEWFHYYTTDQSPWRTDPATQLTFPPLLPGYAISQSDSWLWHLAPQWLEGQNYGEIHTVRALLYRANGSQAD